MNVLDVPCPRCGSVEVVVGSRAEPPTSQDRAVGGPRPHIPRLHLCQCKNCRHSFRHDFAFAS